MQQYKKILASVLFGSCISSAALASNVDLPVPAFPTQPSTIEVLGSGGYLIAENPTQENQVDSKISNPIDVGGGLLMQGEGEAKAAAFHLDSKSLITPMTVPTQYTFSNCTAFTLGTGLYATLTAQGQAKCFNTYSASDIKIIAQATSQPSGVNYDIFVYYYNDVTSTLELKSTSQLLGNVDEYAAAKMPGGNYLIYVQATTGSSATSFIVGALGYSAYDQYEANDVLQYSTLLSGNQAVVGNSDYAGDFDYYAYTTESDQVALQIKLSSANHAAQVYNGSGWSALSGSAPYTVAGSTTYFVRVYNTASPNNTAVNYTLVMSWPVESLGSAAVTNNEGLTNIGLGLETHSRVIFAGAAHDSKGRIVPFGVVNLYVYAVTGTYFYAYQTTANGLVNYTMNYTPCTGGGYYGTGLGGSVPPGYKYAGMSSAVGMYQLCSP